MDLEVHLDQTRFIDSIAKMPTTDQQATDLKNKGYIEVHPLDQWAPYMAEFQNKFYVDDNNVVHAPGNLPLTPIQKAFNDVKGQLTSANTDINDLENTNKDLVSQVNSITNSNKQLANNADQAKNDAKKSAQMMSGLVAQIFQLKAQLKK